MINFSPDTAEEDEFPYVIDSKRVEAVPARERLKNFTTKRGRDYFGRDFEDGYITAPKFSSVMGCSHDTALRWLERFDEAGILTVHGRTRVKMYSVTDEFADIRQTEGRRNYRTAEEITDTATELLQLADSI